jgi:hypothetical protein
MAPIDEPPYRAPDACEPGPAEKATCTKRLFGSQEMPPVDAFTQEQTGKAPLFIPNTLHNYTTEAMLQCDVLWKPKKAHKRSKKSHCASTMCLHQLACGSEAKEWCLCLREPIRFKDGPAPAKEIM